MTIAADRSYWQGLGDAEPADAKSADNCRVRRCVVSVDGSIVTYVLPISGRRETCAVADFEAWAAG